MKFALGRLFATPSAILAAKNANDNLIGYLKRHAAGDWGDVSNEDKRANMKALKEGSRLLSAYYLKDGTKICIVTEADRSTTIVLVPAEY